MKNKKQVGHIISFFAGVAKLKGLPNVFINETLLDKDNKEVAIVIGFDLDHVEALFFQNNFDLNEPVYRSNKTFSIQISENVTGRIINGLGKPIDNLGNIESDNYPVFTNSPTIIDRESINQPLSTGIKILDTTLPLGKGQRQLIIGDRKLGKTTIATDIVLNQKNATPLVQCVYVICGQKEKKLKDLISLFEKNNAFLYTTIVTATSNATFAEQYLAPFVGCTIAEYFRNKNQDALVVYDDLSSHAKTYRNFALLLERSPGRESYPGDVFSIYAGLLERSAKIANGGSLSALPIIETQESDITSFIPTNLISITDGQIYLEQGLFQKGFLPAVNVGLSVSRVGSSAQPKILKNIVGGIRLALSQHKELQKLSQLETVLSNQAKKKIHRGEMILELLKQPKHVNISWPEQVVLFYVVEEGFFDQIASNQWSEFENSLLKLVKNKYPNILEQIKNNKFDDSVKTSIKQMIKDFQNEFIIKLDMQ